MRRCLLFCHVLAKVHYNKFAVKRFSKRDPASSVCMHSTTERAAHEMQTWNLSQAEDAAEQSPMHIHITRYACHADCSCLGKTMLRQAQEASHLEKVPCA